MRTKRTKCTPPPKRCRSSAPFSGIRDWNEACWLPAMADDAYIAAFIMPHEATQAEAAHPHMPPSSSVTLGYGYDVGQSSVEDLRATWGPYLTEDELAQLEPYAGEGVVPRTDDQRAAIVASLSNIEFTHDEAAQVFKETSLQKYKALTEEAFPGYTRLRKEAQAVLVDRVYFRGAHPDPDDRPLQYQHYVEIRQAIVEKDSERLLAVIKSFRDEHRLAGTRNRADAEYQRALEGYNKHGTFERAG
jgi:hypothetical protein